PQACPSNALDLRSYPVELVDEDITGYGTAVDLEALDKLVGVGGQMRTNPKTVRGQNRGDERAHRSLPRGARHVHSWDRLLRVAETAEQRTSPIGTVAAESELTLRGQVLVEVADRRGVVDEGFGGHGTGAVAPVRRL